MRSVGGLSRGPKVVSCGSIYRNVLGQQNRGKVFLSPHLWLLGAKHVHDIHSQVILDHLLPAEEVSQTQSAANDEDAHKCEKCGQIFPWNQPLLRWKHRCEPTEIAYAPEHGVRTETDDATLTCSCGKSFPENQRREFVRHKLLCREGLPPAPLGAKRHRATLPRMFSTEKTTCTVLRKYIPCFRRMNTSGSG